MFKVKAMQAMQSLFNENDEIGLDKLKKRAKTLTGALGFQKLAKAIDSCKKLSLDLFFSAKTHKIDCPLRVIVTERGTWQKSVALFLQEKLKHITIDDPFLVKNSDAVIDIIGRTNTGLQAMSVDIKDLYYSLPHDQLLKCVEESIDRLGSAAFQTRTGIHNSNLLELLSFYLKATFVSWEDKNYLQKSGICIGSCLAPILSDIFLAHHDRVLSNKLDDSVVFKVCRFVDDYLVLLKGDSQNFQTISSDVLTVFRECLKPLVLTHESPTDNNLKFLDLKLLLDSRHVCWMYEPRSGKPLLPFSSAHSKLVKRGIANLCLVNALKKSCPHMVHHSFALQVERLTKAGYPAHVLVSVAEKLVTVLKRGDKPDKRNSVRKSRLVVLPYVHDVSHRLKKIARDANVFVVFSAPEKLQRLCKRVNAPRANSASCSVAHRTRYIPCAVGVVYLIPLTCGCIYVGQTGRCINDRLREHRNNVHNVVQGHLGIHCRDCGCTPLFDQCSILARHRDQLTREIIEAEKIHLLGDKCVSTSSIALSQAERDYLAGL
ncbi:uncharacterized protein LOC142777277 [Rhipicephalus microplus]|uniref:uncharacterized protein LOC142777277 n=1 Tax=Rhipicephalus microplus TaxID=6941 RepID=UPI003F6C4BF8